MNHFSLEKINPFLLSQVILPKQDAKLFPCAITLTTTELQLDKQCLSEFSFDTNATEKPAKLNKNELIELVVFSNITFQMFTELVLTTEVTLHALTAINHRNQQVSYRFSISTQNITSARQALINFTEKNSIEAALVKNAPKLETPGLLVMDMDSTTIEIECIDEIAALAGVGEEVSAVTELAMQGKLDFSESLYQRVATLENAPEHILASVANNIPLMKGLKTLIAELKQHNWRVAIASGGFTYFADHLKNMLALDAAYANTLEIVNGKLTGKVLGKIVDAKVKAECLLQLSNQYNIPHVQTVAMGDGANDLVMMEAANLGIAFHAKSIVKEKADTAINAVGLDCMIHWLS